MLAAVAKGNKMQDSLYIKRYFSFKNPLNSTVVCPLTPNMNVHGVHQVCTTLLAVSMDFHLELFDVLTGSRTRIIRTDSLFQFLVRVNPVDFKFAMSDKFFQETSVGYNNGSMISVGIADSVKPKPGDDVEMSKSGEETKNDLQAHLDSTNFAMFQELLDKDLSRGLLKRKMLPKNIKAVGHCQVEAVTA